MWSTSRFRRGLSAHPLTGALALSLLLHFCVIAGVELGREAGLWRHSLLPASWHSSLPEEIQKTAKLREEQARQEQQRQPPEAELVFIDVDPEQAAAAPPKNAKYYSNRNTVAANPEQGQKEQPKVNGKQERVPKTMDTRRPDPKLPQAPVSQKKEPEVMHPSPAPPQNQIASKNQSKTGEKEKPAAEKEGETLLAKAAPRPEPQTESNPSPSVPQRRHARTLSEAKANKGIIESPKMRQNGGVHRASLTPSFNVKETPFGSYDAKFIAAVQARWFSLLDQRDYTGSDTGAVVVEFRLRQDGRITDLRVVQSGVSEILSWFCQRAILDPAPYEPFPSDLRRMMDSDYREIRFTFYYNQY